jgi:uncharacterized protein YecE (DUF72 family)
MPTSRTSARIGCSGWQYQHWRGNFYPATLPQNAWLDYYVQQFDTVEINNTFYRLPEASSFQEWRRRAPRRFEYAVKASRFLTHMKKLKDPDEPTARFFDRAQHLERAFGPVLFQLPPRWPVNLERLGRFLDALPPRHRYAIEFREPSWYAGEVLQLLESRGVALCLHDMPGSESGRLVTGRFVYVRFHGSHGGRKYGGTYSDQMLESWAAWLANCLRDGLPIYAYFNNDAHGYAPRDAARLREKIQRRNAFAA